MPADFREHFRKFTEASHPARTNSLARRIVKELDHWTKKELPLPELAQDGSQPQIMAASQQAFDLRDRAVEAYKFGSRDPKTYTDYWRARYLIDGAKVGVGIIVPDCDWTEEQIHRPMIDIAGKEVPGVMIYLPAELLGKEGIEKLGKMRPEISWDPKGVVYTHNSSGWIKVMTGENSPNKGATEDEVAAFAHRQGYIGARGISYLLMSTAFRDFTGAYPISENTVTRLLGSRYMGATLLSQVSLPLDPESSWRGLGFSAGIQPSVRGNYLTSILEQTAPHLLSLL